MLRIVFGVLIATGWREAALGQVQSKTGDEPVFSEASLSRGTKFR